MTIAVDVGRPAVLELDDLSKVYRRRKSETRAVDGITLAVRPGEIYGFLGPNGAGKSTTIRMALGLIAPTAGTVRLFGADISKDRDALRRVGSLADGGSFYPHLSGRENLRVLSRTMGLTDAPVDRLLGEVDLEAGARRKVKEYSLGMKQRLGVAAALLGNPDLVILDEPTNGLDAAGIRDMRALIRSLADGGKSVFLSSHLLNEVQQLCDRVAIVARGRLLREATIGELLGNGSRFRLEVDPAQKAAEVAGVQWKVDVRDNGIEVEASREEVPRIVACLVEAGVSIFGVTGGNADLEAIFLEMTGGEHD